MHHFRATSGNPGMVTLPEHFKRSGYRTFDIGKVFNNNERTEDPWSWTEPSFKGYDYYKWVTGLGMRLLSCSSCFSCILLLFMRIFLQILNAGLSLTVLLQIPVK